VPGELGNEEEGMNVGYYEHRYKQDGEPMCDPDTRKHPVELETRPNSKMVMNVIKRAKEIKNAKSK
jgi:hypothetical protein